MALWHDDLIDWVRPYTKSSRARLTAMAEACQRIETEEVEGDIVECGVWRGGNLILARVMCPARVCWLYDTFDGMTNPSQWDVTRKGTTVHVGKTVIPIEEVIGNFKRTTTFDPSKLRFVKGPVEITLLDKRNLPDRIALLRLDTDWYHSTKAELTALWPRLVPGGVLIIDDYGHWLGARKAVDEYFNFTFPFTRIDKTAVMMVKP